MANRNGATGTVPAPSNLIAPSGLEVEDLEKSFLREDGTSVSALVDVSLNIEKGEFVVLLGPSGCGKSTLLRSIAGLEAPDQGKITLGNEVVYSAEQGINVSPQDRALGMMFQSYALWPHMTARENVAYPMRAQGLSKHEARSRAEQFLELVGVLSVQHQYPGGMSGGQQQRVALARCLVGSSHVILFDEPLSNVDAKVRAELRHELAAFQESLGFTALYVTHDQEEAMELGDRVVVMSDGSVLQVGTPEDIYYRPASLGVAEFVGRINRVVGMSYTDESGVRALDTSQLGGVLFDASQSFDDGEELVAVFRPESVRVEGQSEVPSGETRNVWNAVVKGTVFTGSGTEYRLVVGDQALYSWQQGIARFSTGDEVAVRVDPVDVRIYPAVSDQPMVK